MDGGRSRGDEEMVVVMRERITVVSGSTARGDRGAMLLCVVLAMGEEDRSWAVGERSSSSEGDGRLEEE
jgi:hypothetical protein